VERLVPKTPADEAAGLGKNALGQHVTWVERLVPKTLSGEVGGLEKRVRDNA
jgi:hypothetical protein